MASSRALGGLGLAVSPVRPVLRIPAKVISLPISLRAPELPLKATPICLFEVEDHHMVVVSEQRPSQGEARLVVGAQGFHDRPQSMSLGVEKPLVQVRELDAAHPSSSRSEVAHLWPRAPSQP